MNPSDLPLKPNNPILLEETTITQIEDDLLPEPCPIRVILYLAPRIQCRIESDELPRWLSQEKFQREPFFITIDNGHKIKVGNYKHNLTKTVQTSLI